MRIGIITPAPPGSRYGNRVTAVRWAQILHELGHRVSILQRHDRGRFDLLIALHARRSHPSVTRFHDAYPDAPVVVALTGTDLYRDLKSVRHALEALEIAARIVVLQPKALDELASHLRRKARVIYQSVESRPETLNRKESPQGKSFDICVIGHLRDVKDPFRAAMATRMLPPSSKIRILQVGEAMTPAMAARARAEEKQNSRYRWLGKQPPSRVRQILSRCRLCVLSSKIEGVANVLSEAIVAGVPLLASRIPGNVGILGKEYKGYFRVGDTLSLERLLARAETDARFLGRLEKDCNKLARLFRPVRERAAWASLLRELSCW